MTAGDLPVPEVFAPPERAPEPLVELTVAGVGYTLLGTAHVSRASADKVAELLGATPPRFDAVAVELCASRHAAMVDPDTLARLDLFAAIRHKRAAMVAASLALASYQQRIAEQFGIEPGAEQRVALELATRQRLPVLPIDRDVGITLRRVARGLSWWKRWNLFAGLLQGMLSRERVSAAEVERLKRGDVLETTFAEFARDRADLYVPLIAERDRYMAARLRLASAEHGYRQVLAVVGAGHLHGLAEQLARPMPAPREELAALESVPPPNPLWKWAPWALVLVIVAVFGFGFTRSPRLGWELVLDWVLINGTLAALGTASAGAHPLTILAAFCAAPLTSLNPTIGAGMVAAAVELYLRRPRVGDFRDLRDAVATLAGWWRNRVSRVLLVFLLSTLGAAAGTYIASFHIVARLFD